MAKRKGDLAIGQRMAEEIDKLPVKKRFRKSSVCAWRQGVTPGGLPLATLHYCGGDVIYVLTGRRV